VSIDPSSEQLLSLTEATKLTWLPIRRNGRRPCLSTIWRWAMVGVRGIRLETLVCGGVRCTSEAALKRFFAQLTIAAEPQIPAPAPNSLSPARRKAIEAAEKRLAAAGI
jgi:hypothetical protein